jgi:hypothetical protein
MRGKSADFNSVLTGANLLVLALLLWALATSEGNRNVNQETIALGALLCLQTHIALWFERRRRDPFVILLAFTTIFYFSLRIYTLTLYEFSDVFERYAYTAADSNYALIFIIIANLFLYFGLYLVKIRGNQRVDATGWEAASSKRIVVLLVVAILFAYSSGGGDPDATPSRIAGFLSLFLAPNIIVLMALSYFFLFRKTLRRGFAFTVATLIILEMIVHTLTGSRSAIVVIVQNSILVGLAMAGSIKFPRKYLVASVVLLPVLAALLVGSFAVSTYNRAVKLSGGSFDIGRAIDSAMQSGSGLPIKASLDLVLPQVFSRAGFFDYSAEIIAHREQYHAVINLPAYGRSIVDNVLTPGFDVYDQPKISNSLLFVYRDWGEPSKVQVATMEGYQSDQLGLYGEWYALFEYWCLPLLCAGAYLLKSIYVRLKSANPFVLLMKRVVVLFVFERVLDSFGLDWTVEETIPLLVAIFIYAMFFAIRPSVAPQSPTPAAVKGSNPLLGAPAASR